MGDHKLPVELIDHCLSYLRREHRAEEDKPYHNAMKDFKSCALVSRTWRPFAQDHLFREITYGFTKAANDADIPGTENEVDTAADFPSIHDLPNTLESLCSFLDHYPRLASRIRIIYLGSDSRENVYETGPEPEHRADQALFRTVVSLLPRLREMHLGNVVLESENIRPLGERPSLDELVLHYTDSYEYLDVEDIRRVISYFERIGKLSIRSLSSNQYLEPLTAPIPAMPNRVEVQHLVLPPLDPGAPANLRALLLLSVHVDRVRSLTLQDHCPTIYQDIVDVLSPGLENLRFVMEQPIIFEGGPAPDSEVDIRACARLRTLHVQFGTSSYRPADGWRWHTQGMRNFINQAIISSSTYPNFREFTISLNIGHTDGERANPRDIVKPLDELLVALVRRSMLKNITFEWVECYTPAETLAGEEFAQFIYQAFPELRRDDMIIIIIIRAPVKDEDHIL